MANDMELAGGNLFMMCSRLDTSALTGLPEGYHIRTCRREELDLWKTIHFDDPAAAEEQKPYMTRFFEIVYAPEGEAFWERCLFLCRDEGDEPVGTCFAWKAYGRVMTIHWYKIRRDFEGRGWAGLCCPKSCGIWNRRTIPYTCTRTPAVSGRSSCTRILVSPC